jgi:Na+/H+ antiporter NhaD/arsenite permease-like protein
MVDASLGGVASIVLFAAVIVVVIALVVRPVSVHLPWSAGPLALSYSLVPVLGGLLLLAFRCLTVAQLWDGIRGSDHIKPYGIVILFMSLAYQAASLDATGGLAWLALHITNWSRGRGRRLFVFYFLLSALLTVLTNNDVSIMTLTPIIHHFAKATGADPLPFQVAMFSAANLFSMALLVG